MIKLDTHFGNAAIRLLKGPVIYPDIHYVRVLEFREQLEAYFNKLGLTLEIDEDLSYAFLKRAEGEEFEDFNRLGRKQNLTMLQTLVLVALKETFLENSQKVQGEGDDTCITTLEEIQKRCIGIIPDRTDEIKDEVEFKKAIRRLIEYGVGKELSLFKDEDEVVYEILPIIESILPQSRLMEVRDLFVSKEDKLKEDDN